MRALLLFATCTFAIPAAAQATRTWVAPNGEDANPCSPTQPCKTFAGAISKTAAGGEINCAAPGGYGPVTITKSITIDCSSTYGSILAGSGHAVVVNAATTDVVRLRGLSLSGTIDGGDGVRVLQAGTVFVEQCTIAGFRAATASAISAGNASNAVALIVTDVTLENDSAGVKIATTDAGTARATITRAIIGRCGSGVTLDSANAQAVVRDTTIANCGAAVHVGSASASALVDGSTLSFNGTGIEVINGVARVGRTTITGSTTNGINAVGTVISFGDNHILGNTGNQTPTNVLGGQ